MGKKKEDKFWRKREKNMTPRMVDFTRQSWGHALHSTGVSANGVLTGSCHATPGPRVGDKAKWETASGFVVAEFTMVKPYRDPSDMYSIECKIVDRIPRE